MSMIAIYCDTDKDIGIKEIVVEDVRGYYSAHQGSLHLELSSPKSFSPVCKPM